MIDRARISRWVDARMVAQVVVRRPNTVDPDRGATVTPGTLAVVRPVATTVYTGRAMISSSGAGSRGSVEQVGARPEADSPVVVGFPLGTDIRPDDEVTVTSIAGDLLAAGALYCVHRVRRSTRRGRVVCDASEYRS